MIDKKDNANGRLIEEMMCSLPTCAVFYFVFKEELATGAVKFPSKSVSINFIARQIWPAHLTEELQFSRMIETTPYSTLSGISTIVYICLL